jgi:membrane protein YqaA with SNARE-associated domain
VSQDVAIVQSKNVVRRLYDWVLSWAESPYGASALLVLSFAESSFFPVPPDVLLIALCISAPTRAFKYAFLCTCGSLIGGIGGYGIGYYGYEAIGKPIIDFYDGHAVMEKIRVQYETYGFWGVLVAAITPIPYKVFTISSGFFSFSFASFFFASLVGRAIRFFAVSALIWKFGSPIRAFIDKYFNLLAVAFVVLLLGGFVIIKLIAY